MRLYTFVFFMFFVFSVHSDDNRVDFDFNSISVRDALQLLADYKRQNIVLSSQVNGDISLKLKNVSWSQAFDYVVTVAHLDVVFDGDTILVSSLNEDHTFTTQPPNLDLPPLYPVNYYKLQNVSPSLIIDSFHLYDDEILLASDDAALLTAYLPSDRLADLELLIKTLDYERPQILIESRIVEVNRDYSKSIGVDWSADRSGSFNASAGSSVSPAAANFLSLGYLSDSLSLDAKLSLMESSGNGFIVSSPKVFVFDRTPARISKGVEVPYQELQGDGVVTTSFKSASLSLDVLPKLSDDFLLLDINLTKDEPDFSKVVSGQPPITTASFTSSVRLLSGQTVALGGVFSKNTSQTYNSVPFLSSVPLLGSLFKGDSSRTADTELILFITATLIPPSTTPNFSQWFSAESVHFDYIPTGASYKHKHNYLPYNLISP